MRFMRDLLLVTVVLPVLGEASGRLEAGCWQLSAVILSQT